MGYKPPSDPDRLRRRQQATQAQQSCHPAISLEVDDQPTLCGSTTTSRSHGDLYPTPLAPQKPDPERLRKALNEPDPFSPLPPPDSPRPATYRNRFVSSSAPPFEPLPTPFAAIHPDMPRLAQSASHTALLQAMDFDLLHPRTPPNAPSETMDLDLLHHRAAPTLPSPPQTSPPAAAAAAAAMMAEYHHNRLTQLRCDGCNSIRTAPPPHATTRSSSSPQYQYQPRPQARWTPTSNPDFTRPRTFGIPPNIDTTYSSDNMPVDNMNRMDIDPPRPQYTNPNPNPNPNSNTDGNVSGAGATHSLLARAAAMSLATAAASGAGAGATGIPGYPRPWDSPPVSTFDFDSDTDDCSNFGSETESEWESLMLDL
ncbi:hypothetical protein C8A01DRAFT_37373 [Parachaetomium inaequale]|uniref:Uncharacterized protein n=1 Tax=Parachaetomium inaequale TaxID=2588326 RepID=A0AAN6PEV3_9PEZI|nr:hypothetical protein C8A01DRAFT_37373 [Parachaetomium inaequale]